MDGTVSAENFQENTLGGMSVNQKKDQKKDACLVIVIFSLLVVV